MSKIRVRAPLACRIVGLDRVKFNDAVASGAYPCAPPTMKGSARLFDEESLLPLYFFARLTEFGIPASRAGQLVCEMASLARNETSKDADRIVLLRGRMGETFVASVANAYGIGGVRTPISYDPDHEKNGAHYPAIGRILFTIEFYVSHVRQIIADAIEEERNILGEEEDA